MKENPELRKDPVHVRQTEIKTYDLGEHRVLVEANLRDTRTPPRTAEAAESPMVLVHDLVARIWVQGPDLTIAAVQAEMRQVPREMCLEILPDMQKLVGLKIVTGYTQKVKKLIGDVKGCSHLTHLFLNLGPAAVQGYWAAYGRKPGARSLANPALSRVIDSCRVWRKDGPLFRTLAAEPQKKTRES